MRKYTVPTLLCAALLLVSALARALLEWPPFVTYFPYFMWVHVAVIALAFYGFWVLRKAASAHLGGLGVFVRGVPLWLVVLALPVALAVAPMVTLITSSLGTTPDGHPVHSKSWVEEGGRHYVVLNRTVRVEITNAEYTESYREMYVGFSSAWILFSYLVLVLWHYNWRREGVSNAG
ncbi:MAG: hypothetical protein U1E89_22315 [Burkholderiaceae bacterium]